MEIENESGGTIRYIVGTLSAAVGASSVGPQTNRLDDQQIFAKMAENIQEIFWMLDANTYEVIYVSPAFETICGMPCQRLYDSPTSYREIIHPEDRARVLTRLEELPKTGRFEEAFRIVRPTGVVRWVLTRGFLAPDQRGRAAQLVGTVVDITERKTAERLLVGSEEKFQLMARNIKEIFWIIEPRTLRLVYASPAYESIWERPHEEIARDPTAYLQSIHSEDRARILAKLSQLETVDHLEAEYRIVCSDGRVKWLVSNGFTVRDPQGPLTFVGTTLDVTARHESAEALRRSEQDYRSLFEDAPYGVFRATPDGRFLIANPSLVKMLGYGNESDLLGGNLKTHIRTEPNQSEKGITEWCVQEAFENAELHWKRTDGKELLVRASGRLVRDAAGSPAYSEVVVEDITERRALEDEVRHSQKLDAVALLASGISHDFNTLLTGMLGFGELLLMSSRLGDEERRKVEAIVDSAIQARSITQQLLAFGRSQPMQPAVLSLNRAIMDLTEFIKRMVGEHTALMSDLQVDLGAVRIDRTQLSQVILNVVANARDAMPQGGRLTIRTSSLELRESDPELPGVKPGDYAVVAITDTGSGMDEKVKAHIFEPFFSTKPEGRGNGLGLAMVHGIIDQSAGYVRVWSEPGEGTTLKILLPIVPEQPVEALPQRIDRRVAPGCQTILVVDDNDLARSVTVDFLSLHGYDVLSGRNGIHALQVAKKHTAPIHLLVTDIVMQRMSGPNLAARLGSLHPETKILYVTGYADLLDFSELRLGNGCEFLRKPFLRHELMAKVHDLLGELLAH
jgi:PAS domain S-box-containing protein